MPADLVLVGGQIWTGDPDRPRAEALAVRGDRVIRVGTDDSVRPLIGEATRVIELAGRSVTPGLTDCHAHLGSLGASLDRVDVRGAESAEAAARAAGEAAAEGEGEGWILGRGWDQNRWPGGAFPTREILDAAVGDRPVVLTRVDGHALWASSAALARAGIDRNTEAPEGGEILRAASGEPTGILVDRAMDLVLRHVPDPDDAELRSQILRAAAIASAAGLTGVHEMGVSARLARIYRELAEDGELPLRVYVFLAGPEAARGLRPDTDASGADRLAIRGVKLFADGALGSRGARLLEPYADAADSRGLWLTEPETLASQVAELARDGWQVAIHAIGDAGNRAVLDAYEAAPRGGRLRVEHAQVLAAEDVERFEALGVIASMQPTHATSDMPWAEARLGPERIRGAYAWRRLLDAGARICAGSDFPVEGVSPLLGLWAATTRMSPDGAPAGGWYADQKMSLDEALAAFTREPAHASFSETELGRLAPGRLADLTVYDRPLATAQLLETRIDATVVGGRVVFERN